MNPQDFIKKAILTDMPGLDYTPVIQRLNQNKYLTRILHAATGMSGESGEVLDSVKKAVYYGKPLNKDHLLEETGDILWYMAIMLHQLGSSFEEVMQKNVDKLKKRYPDGFTETDAMSRQDKGIK